MKGCCIAVERRGKGGRETVGSEISPEREIPLIEGQYPVQDWIGAPFVPSKIKRLLRAISHGDYSRFIGREGDPMILMFGFQDVG